MRLFLFILSLLLAAVYSFGQPAIEWQKSFGGSLSDLANAVQQTTADGGYIIAGKSNSNNGDVSGHHGDTTNVDYWVVRLNSSGAIQWQRSLGGTDDDEATSVIQCTDGGFMIAGFSASTDGDVTGNHGNDDYWIVKLDADGVIEWKKCYGGYYDDDAYSIQQTKDGGYILAGSTYSNDSDVTVNNGNDDYWIVKLDSAGSIQWQKSLGGSQYDEAYSIKQTADSGYIVAGTSNSNDSDVTGNHGGYDYWVVKLNSSGSLQWQKSYGGSSDDIAYSVDLTADGGYIVAGYSSSADGDVTGNDGSDDYWILKLNSSGGIEWQMSLGGNNDDESYSIQKTGDGGYIIAGYSFSNNGDVTGNHGSADYWVVKMNGSGSIEWQECLGGSSFDAGKSIVQTADGGYIVAGYSFSNDGEVTGNHGYEDFWIVKLSPSTGINEYNSSSALEVYPNPVQNELRIKSECRMQNAECRIEYINIYNALGQLIHPINCQISNFEFQADVSSLSAGVYFIKAGSSKASWFGRFVKE